MAKKSKENLTPKEQKTTAAFKLQREQIHTLEESLKKTQNALEGMKDKYHEADKNSAVLKGKNKTIGFHELLKYLIGIGGGYGATLLGGTQMIYGLLSVFGSAVLYAIVVWFDRK